jgi:hypothetical protein
LGGWFNGLYNSKATTNATKGLLTEKELFIYLYLSKFQNGVQNWREFELRWCEFELRAQTLGLTAAKS